MTHFLIYCTIGLFWVFVELVWSVVDGSLLRLLKGQKKGVVIFTFLTMTLLWPFSVLVNVIGLSIAPARRWYIKRVKDFKEQNQFDDLIENSWKVK